MSTQFKHIKYAFFFPELREIKLFLRIQHVTDNRMQGTKDIEIAHINLSNKYDSKKIVSFLASCDYDLFKLVTAIDNKTIKLKGTISINSIQ